ncbi:MAG: HK97 gp10 family phage protein [candidate division Zixibacteria bacterium]|nr:HK97 gp10 family phage protein [candidate division Zixibacteria bacterium]
MARRTRKQIDADKIIKKGLNVLGEKVYNQARSRSRVDTGRLRDSVNFRVKPDTVLTVGQVFYGKFQKPDELIKAVEDHIDDSTKIVVTEINDQLLAPFKTKRK